MRYLVYGYYGYGNFGDDLLLKGVVEGVALRDPNATFCVHSLDSVPEFERDPSVRFTGLARYLQGVRRRPWRALAYLAAFARWIERCEALIIGGGTLFIDKGRLNVSLILLLLAVWYARVRGRDVVVIGVAIDRMSNGISLWAMRRIFAAARFVSVRDDLSVPYIEHVQPGRFRRASDLVFGLTLGPITHVAPRKRPVLGMCFIDYFRTVEPSGKAHHLYISAIVQLIERHKSRYDFASIVFQSGIGQRDDWLIPVLQERFPEMAIMRVDSMGAARRMLENIDLLLTTRFHLGILGIIWGKPVIVIDHELKMASLATGFFLPVVSLGDFVTGGEIDIDDLLRGYDQSKTSAACAAERDLVARNFDWLDVTRRGISA